jgi:hypothetical protein
VRRGDDLGVSFLQDRQHLAVVRGGEDSQIRLAVQERVKLVEDRSQQTLLVR